jgi:hypothetical protein
MLVVDAKPQVLLWPSHGDRAASPAAFEVRLDPPRVAVSRSITSSISAAPSSWC